MNKVKILIVEDEILIAEDLKDILLSFGVELIDMAHDKTTAIAKIESFNPEIVLLDIRMEKETDGLEVGEYLMKKGGISYIYITAHSDVAMVKKIIETQPAGYITKPIKKSDLFANINLSISRRNENAGVKNLQVKDGYGYVLIPQNEIRYLESDGNYININAENKKMISRQSLDSLMEELDQKMFFKIHRSYIVNISKIVKYTKKEVMLDNITLPISRNSADDFEKFMKGNH